jgi:hypothetical protein
MSREEIKFPCEKVLKIKPNDRNVGWIKNPRHAGYFKLEGCYDSFAPTRQRNGQISNVLSKEDIEVLSKELGRGKEELGVYNKDSIVANRNVRLNKETRFLDLSDPFDFIDYKILLTNTDKIAPSIKDKTKKATYKYYIEDEDDLNEVKKTTANINQVAWKEYGKIEDNPSKLAAFLKVYGQMFNKPFQKIDKSVKLDKLQADVTSIIEDKMTQFVEIVQSDNFDIMLLLAEGIETGVIKKEGTKYLLADGDLLGKTLTEAITYLKAAANQELLLVIEEKIKLKSE